MMRRIAATIVFVALLTTVWAQYSYVNGKNYANLPGNDVQRNLFGLGLTVRAPAGR